MTDFLLAVVLLVLFVRWLVLRSRFTELQTRLEELRFTNQGLENQVVELTKRVFALEKTGAPRAPAVAAAPLPVTLPVAPVAVPMMAAPPPVLQQAQPQPEPAPQPEPEYFDEPQPVPAPKPRISSADLEALIGGNWLPKLGVLVLVIGIALLLGYSLTQFGPIGKVAVGYLVGIAMLGAGIFTESRESYRVLGRALIAGGWAALYFTTYALHALPAARLIDDPALGMGALLAVSLAMVAHSLRYRSESIAALTFFTAYLALALTGITGASLLATVPLSVLLAVLSWRYGWTRLAVAGVVYTYGTYILQHPGPPAAAEVFTTQVVFWLNWAVFEAYDLATARGLAGSFNRWRDGLFPLNAAGFLGVALLPGSPFTSPESRTHFLIAAAVAYAAGAVVRALRAPAEAEDRPWAFHPYEFGVALSAALIVAVVFRTYDGYARNTALLVEAEFLVLAGLVLRRRFLQYVGGAVILLPVVKLLTFDLTAGKKVALWGASLYDWTPVALLTAALLALNRRLSPRLVLYSWGATLTLVANLGLNLPPRYVGIAWLALAGLLFELRVRTGRVSEFGAQSYALGLVAFLAVLVVKLLGLGVNVAAHPWETLGAAAVLTYAATLRVFLLHDRLGPQERANLLRVVSFAGGLALALLMWYVLPAPLIGVGWTGLALVLFEFAPLTGLGELRRHAHIAAIAALVRLVLSNLNTDGETAFLSHRLLTVVPVALVFYYLAARLSAETPRPRIAAFYLYAAWLLLVATVRFELGRAAAVLGWSAFLLVLVVAGTRWNAAHLRYQAYLLAALIFARSWASNFFSLDLWAGVPARILSGALVVATLYAAQFLTPRTILGEDANGPPVSTGLLARADRFARQYFSLLGTALLAILLFLEVSGRVLTVAWGLQGVALLIAGFPTRERVFRLSGLTLFLFCMGKLFFYDLRNLDTLSRIFSFIVLGLLMVGASWLYSRFRERVRRLL